MSHGSRPQYRVLVEKNVPMKTRDGVLLRADVYRPDAAGRFPVLLSRLPYKQASRPPRRATKMVALPGYQGTYE